jgi:tetratricopeptide (TPR) repeat protein
METGRCLMELERFDEAVGYLAKRVAIGEDPTDALLLLAETQRRAHDMGSALETLKRVPAEGRRGARAAVAMADIFAEVGATTAAREKVRVALRLDGNDAEALLRDAIYRYQDEGDLDAAAENLLRLLAQPSIDQQPELRDRAARHLGTIYRLDGSLGKAHRYLDPLVARDPEDIPSHFQLAKVRLAEADVADVIGPFTAALEQGDCGEARAWFLLGQMHMHGQNLEAAVESFHHAIELEPGYAPATFSLIHFLAQFDNPDEVRRLIRDLYTQAEEEPIAPRPNRDFHVLFELAPLEHSVRATSDQLEQTDAGSVEHTMLEALFYDHLGDHARAAPLFLALAEGRSGEPVHWLHLGRMAWDDGRIDEAAGHFATAVEQAPTKPLYLYLSARMLEEEARNDRARELYERLLEYRPGDVMGTHGLARLDHRLGDLDGAQEHYNACHFADDGFLPAWRDHLLLDMGQPLTPGVL